METETLPQGCRFRPTDRQIMDLLMIKLRNDRDFSVQTYIPPEFDVLEYEPSQIFESLAMGSDTECYFYAPRKRKYPNSTRIDRSTRGGFWKPTGKRPEILAIGIKRRLVYYERRPELKKTDWSMHEYELNDMKDFVFCRLRKKMDKKAGRQKKPNSNLTRSIGDCMGEDIPLEVYSQTKKDQESLLQYWQELGNIEGCDINLNLDSNLDEFDQDVSNYLSHYLLQSPVQSEVIDEIPQEQQLPKGVT